MWLAEKTKLQKLMLDAVFLAVALILSYVEYLFPMTAWVPLPGFKLGLANMITMLLAVKVSMVDAVRVSLLRVILMALLFGSPVSFWFSLGGALCSLLAVAFIRRLSIFSFVGLSVLSAAAHNIGQLLAASVLFGIAVIPTYLPLMMPTSVLFGGILGFLLNFIMPRISTSGECTDQ